MDVDIDEAGGEVEAGDVYGLLGGAGRDRRLDGGDLAVENRYIAVGVDVVLRVDDVAVAEDEIVLLGLRRVRLRGERTGEEQDNQDARHGWKYSQRFSISGRAAAG